MEDTEAGSPNRQPTNHKVLKQFKCKIVLITDRDLFDRPGARALHYILLMGESIGLVCYECGFLGKSKAMMFM